MHLTLIGNLFDTIVTTMDNIHSEIIHAVHQNIKQNHALSSKILVCLYTFVLFHLPAFSQIDNLECPPYYSKLEAGKQCVFLIANCASSSEAKQHCNERNSELYSLRDKTHFNDLCRFVTKRAPNNPFFFLGAHRKNGESNEKFIWDSDNKEVSPDLITEKDQGNDCLALIASKKGCSLRDTQCDKQAWPLCEFLYGNPCLVNKGDCDEKCIPRSRDERKCECYGKIVSHTWCNETVIGSNMAEGVTCQNPKIPYTASENTCLVVTEQHRIRAENRVYCTKKPEFYMSDLVLDQPAKMDRLCHALRHKYGPFDPYESYYIRGNYMNKTNQIRWDDNLVSNAPRLCLNKTQDIKGQVDLNCMIFIVGKDECCFQVDDCSTKLYSICIGTPGDVCRENLGNCPADQQCYPKPGHRQFVCHGKCPVGKRRLQHDKDCVDYDWCGKENGGCHHECKPIVGGMKCECMPGYTLVNNTECRYIDKCKGNDGTAGCPKNGVVGAGGRMCQTINPDDDVSGDGSSSIFWGLMIATICLLILLILSACYFLAKRKRNNEHDSVKDAMEQKSNPEQISVNDGTEKKSTIEQGSVNDGAEKKSYHDQGSVNSGSEKKSNYEQMSVDQKGTLDQGSSVDGGELMN